jgi:threonine dehydrogenase-like Zn-dependent dehydrogenase
LVSLLVAKHHGADVSVVDLSHDRLAVASKLGADWTGSELEGEFDVVIDAVGAPATRRSSIERLRPAGTAVWIGLLDSQPAFDALDLVRMEKRVVGMFAYGSEDFTAAVALAPQVDLGWSTSFDLSDGVAIFHELVSGRSDVVKALLRPMGLIS